MGERRPSGRRCSSKRRRVSPASLHSTQWLRANASVEAAQQSVAEQRAHLAEVTSQVSQGNASRADALRVDSAVAGAEATLAEASAQQATAEVRLRTLLRLSGPVSLRTHDAVNAPAEPVARTQSAWIDEAYGARAELRELDAAASAARAQASVARATYVPTVGAFASALYANPNPRYFPPEPVWHGTWAAGVALTWSPTDIPGARARAFEADARSESIVAQRDALRDAISVDVVQCFESVRAADMKVVATDKQLESASEAYRITRSLFANARATTSNVLDAETDLARARLAGSTLASTHGSRARVWSTRPVATNRRQLEVSSLISGTSLVAKESSMFGRSRHLPVILALASLASGCSHPTTTQPPNRTTAGANDHRREQGVVAVAFVHRDRRCAGAERLRAFAYPARSWSGSSAPAAGPPWPAAHAPGRCRPPARAQRSRGRRCSGGGSRTAGHRRRDARWNLAADGAEPTSTYDCVRASAEAARAQLKAVEARAKVARNATAYTLLVADADGVMIETMAEPGQVVAAGQTVVRIAPAWSTYANRPATGDVAARDRLERAGCSLWPCRCGCDASSRAVERRGIPDADVPGEERARGPLADAPLGLFDVASHRPRGRRAERRASSRRCHVRSRHGPGVWTIVNSPRA